MSAPATDRGTPASTSTKWFAVGALVVALLLAGVVSYWASSAPDGLNKVAADTGFGEQEKQHGLDDSPFAGYGTKGLGDGFASGAVAGVAGVGITLALAGGLTLVLRRRAAHAAPAEQATQGAQARDTGGEPGAGEG